MLSGKRIRGRAMGICLLTCWIILELSPVANHRIEFQWSKGATLAVNIIFSHSLWLVLADFIRIWRSSYLSTWTSPTKHVFLLLIHQKYYRVLIILSVFPSLSLPPSLPHVSLLASYGICQIFDPNVHWLSALCSFHLVHKKTHTNIVIIYLFIYMRECVCAD